VSCRTEDPNQLGKCLLFRSTVRRVHQHERQRHQLHQRNENGEYSVNSQATSNTTSRLLRLMIPASVCQSAILCQFSCYVGGLCKTAKRFDVPFGMETPEDPRNIVLNESFHPTWQWGSMRPLPGYLGHLGRKYDGSNSVCPCLTMCKTAEQLNVITINTNSLLSILV